MLYGAQQRNLHFQQGLRQLDREARDPFIRNLFLGNLCFCKYNLIASKYTCHITENFRSFSWKRTYFN